MGNQCRSLAARASKQQLFEKVGVHQTQEGFGITLDKHPLRTPSKNPLVLPSKALALAVAAEWRWQQNHKLQPSTMPLMSLAATAIDEPKPRHAVIDTLLSHVHTDATCCREQTGPIAARQAEVYRPIVEAVSKRLGVQFHVTDSIFGAEQPESTALAIRSYLEGLSNWSLAGTAELIASCRSVVVGIAISEGLVDVEQGLEAARVEENFQIEGWGLVEGGHDIDSAGLKVQVAAPSIFLRLLQSKD
ncbi:hypothetical protein CVIRNUC_007444 [Coccomyxa viridis]|uniref:ATP synthase mitochondrial F1 complex assembly factor 2 n=1 Tax=Coccomyxa viridis TaxID=1274662 RepID=A0AAV1ICL4_9CHLO|nr:hypothetical protein CVIRNUC_007444 [Coccomyxa viridis]